MNKYFKLATAAMVLLLIPRRSSRHADSVDADVVDANQPNHNQHDNQNDGQNDDHGQSDDDLNDGHPNTRHNGDNNDTINQYGAGNNGHMHSQDEPSS